MTYISSLISGVGIFCFGTGLAWYHGVLVLLYPQEMESALWVRWIIPLNVCIDSSAGYCFARWFVDL